MCSLITDLNFSYLDADLFTYVLTIGTYLITLLLVISVLKRKKEPVSALAWILAIVFLPYLGALIFILFGYTHIERPLSRKKFQRKHFRRKSHFSDNLDQSEKIGMKRWESLTRLMTDICGFPVSGGNGVELYTEGRSTYAAMFEAIDQAEKEICLQTYILKNDKVGKNFIRRLARKAQQGVQIKLIYDAIGSHGLPKRFLRPLLNAGGKAYPFLPVNILRRRFQVNLRNHRKLLITDGKVGFVGGLNIGKEYIGEEPARGFWRDTHMRIIGPAVKSLLYVFAEDWNFASGEEFDTEGYNPDRDSREGGTLLQVVNGGPDQKHKAIQKWYHAATSRARKKLWIATPYFIPDETLVDGLRTAALMGVDVRLLTQGYPPEQWLTYFAARYYWEDMLDAGVRIWQYNKGMLHAKVFLVDGELASVGTANFDIRSLELDFEVNCVIFSRGIIKDLEEQFSRDLEDSAEVKKEEFEKRNGWVQAAENACRLFSPLL